MTRRTLEDARDLVVLREAPGAVCGDVRERVETKLREVDRKIAELQAARGTLAALTRSCKGADLPVACCPIIEAMEREA